MYLFGLLWKFYQIIGFVDIICDNSSLDGRYLNNTQLENNYKHKYDKLLGRRTSPEFELSYSYKSSQKVK